METTKAICVLKGSGAVSGIINLKAGFTVYPGAGKKKICSVLQEGGHTTIVMGEIFGLTPGKHGLHVHTFGDISKGFDCTGPHFNPCSEKHGAPQDKRRHVGDLGNIEADENGTSRFEMEDRLLRLAGKYSIIGRSMVVHENEDDLGKGGNPESLESGNQGAGLAWGIIGIDEDTK